MIARDLALGFLTLAVVKAVVEPIARQWGRRRIDSLPPEAWALIDEETRRLLAEGAPGAELKARTREILEQMTGEPWDDASLRPLFSELDVRSLLDRFATR